MSQNIRLAGMKDCPAVEAIVAAAYTPYIARIGHKPGPMLDDYAALIRGQRVYALYNDGVVLGILVLIPETDAMLLDNVAVAPGARGAGFGRSLLEFAERTARGAGYRSIRLYTNEDMAENIALYARIGYAETHRAEEKGFRRVYMTKMLL